MSDDSLEYKELALNRPLRLKCPVQPYTWGKKGPSSLVNRLAGFTGEDVCGAELWVGAHASAPAQVITEDGRQISLREIIQARPQATVGERVYRGYGAALPFLFKILSVGSALSIQVHPGLTQAQRLHQSDPGHYPDANHKPELAIALSEMTLLWGLRDADQVRRNFRTIPELRALAPHGVDEVLTGHRRCTENTLLRMAVEALVLAERDLLEQKASTLVQRLRGKKPEDPVGGLVLQLAERHGDSDPGLLWIYLLNYIELHPGQALFTAPGIVHAYLQGDLVECMANSDNVVRAGLTNKYVDTDSILEVVSYGSSSPESKIVPMEMGLGIQRYLSPATEFRVDVIPADPVGTVTGGEGPAILFCVEGKGQIRFQESIIDFGPGSAYFIPAACLGAQMFIEAGSVYRVRVGE